MNGSWQAYLNLFPLWLRQGLRSFEGAVMEIRLRIGRPAEVIMQKGISKLDREITRDDLNFVINIASQYSPWSAPGSAQGYITTPYGHRIGICGQTAVDSNVVQAIRIPTSVCVRYAREFTGIAKLIADRKGSVLIIGRPGSGKTTLLRDLIRQRSDRVGDTVCVVDERCELFPVSGGKNVFYPGVHVDVMSGCSKRQGIDMVLRSMSPSCIAVDEITAADDCDALFHAAWCGVDLLATAHAGSKADLLSRPIYRPLLENNLFHSLVFMNWDKTWSLEVVRN